ncbi:MAG: hypothetical protein COV31_01390 [Candidatus Yanofskybacteria bacterium CG10_big_fil_rev_8_21_14_0_10_46_23]|uniref:Ada DNA repair metal-binding domain-containing protein n=1 Tax=Candidatus Yanofskybacteria bacterium CG10_big_fil_rev_8_21_14_0_10_46_23 TaxID=1975098 RepID=A0A2H0R4S4_9BACT|nr:MAG: hypothetical protein COV31_01390 [Candidatus Yanofskybacteria bacterium CG10_big_fil_rev_8_21_14_0_10_46_23]
MPEFLSKNKETFVLGIVMFFLAFTAFQIGRIKSPARIQDSIKIYDYHSNPDLTEKDSPQNPIISTPALDLRVVVSKNSTKYHFLWCSGSKSIKEENKIYFANELEAQNRGYTLAGNCTK